MRYEQEVMAIMDRGKEKWCAQGRAQGRAEGQMSTAFNLHRMGMQESFIADINAWTDAIKACNSGEKTPALRLGIELPTIEVLSERVAEVYRDVSA